MQNVFTLFKKWHIVQEDLYILTSKILNESYEQYIRTENRYVFHEQLMEAFKTVAISVGSSVDIFVHHRREGNSWISLLKNSSLLFDGNGAFQSSTGLSAPIYLLQENPILANIKERNPAIAIKEALFFRLFDEFEYLIISEKAKFRNAKFLNYLLVILGDLQAKLDYHLENRRLDQKVKLIESELASTENRLRETDKSLKKRVYEINNLLEISNELYSILDLEQLINSALLILVGQIGCEKAFGLVFDAKKGKYSRHFTKGFGAEHTALDLEVDHPLISFMLKRRRATPIRELYRETSLQDIAANFDREHIQVIAPIIYSDRLRGIIGCGEKLFGNEYDRSDLQILNILVNIFTVSISNAQMYEDMKKMSFTDPMTGLNNFRYFENRLREEIKRSYRNKNHVSLIMLDIDYFKVYNDTLGHQAGDEALKAVASILRSTAREDDIVCRYGGEEFCIILPGTEKGTIQNLAERIRKKIEAHEFYKEHVQPSKHITISLGGAAFPEDAESYEDLVKYADRALYRSKEGGRNRFTFYE